MIEDLDLGGRSYVGKHSSEKITPEKIAHNLDPKDLGVGPARAVAKAIGDGIKAISATSSDGHRKFNVTGRLANGISATFDPERAEFRIETPTDRQLYPRMVERLQELVPAIRDPLADPKVLTEIVNTLSILITPKGG